MREKLRLDYVYDIYKTDFLFPFSENCVSRIHACRLTVITPRLFKIIPITYTFLETRFNSLCNEPLILLLYYDLIHNDIAWVYIRVTIKAFGLLQQAISPAKRVHCKIDNSNLELKFLFQAIICLK